MKELLKNQVAEIEAKMGNLEGFILIAIDKEKQFYTLVGKCSKMIAQIAREDDEIMKLFEDSIKAAKLHKKVNELIKTAKELGVLDEDALKDIEARFGKEENADDK